jgi:hypothetical protein
MAASSQYRDKAEQIQRIVRRSSDPMLIKSLEDLARENLAKANEIDAAAFSGKDPAGD